MDLDALLHTPPLLLVQALALAVMADLMIESLVTTLPTKRSWTTAVALLLAGLAVAGPPVARLAAWLCLAAGAALLAWITRTGWINRTLQRWTADDGWQPGGADVLVVLSATTRNGVPNAASHERLLLGLKLLHAGAAPQITFTGGGNSEENEFHVLAPQAMADLGLPTTAVVPFEPLPQQAMNTRAEALVIQRMAAEHGWQRVLLVTSLTHARRARAVFRHAGLEATVTCTVDAQFGTPQARSSGKRLAMFQRLAHEWIGWHSYRRRGWIG